MSDINDSASDPGYEAEASSTSKISITAFIATFFYLEAFADVTPGFLGSILFILIGMFAVSLCIAMPMLLLQKKLLISKTIIFVTNISATFFLTRTFYYWLFQ